MDIKNPHDKFFVKSFSIQEVAVAYVQHFMSKAVSENLDYTTFELENQSYVDESLREHFSDVVYYCQDKAKKKIRIAILFEHKSYIPDYPHLQVLRYIQGLWAEDVEQERALTPVIPIIIFHGKGKWKDYELKDNFPNLPNYLEPFLPNFQFQVTCLEDIEDEKIKQIGQNFIVNTFLALKYVRYANLLQQHFREIFIFVESRVETHLGRNYFISLYVYLMSASKIPKPKIKDMIQELPTTAEETGLTVYEQIFLEGEEKGIVKGIQKGIQKGMQKGIEVERKRQIAERKAERKRQIAERNALIKMLLKDSVLTEKQIRTYYKISQQVLNKLKKEIHSKK